MSYMVQSPTLLPSTFKEAGGNTEPSPSLGARIKNALFGRICADWKNSILVAGVVFWVTKAALSFFTGYWMMAIVELFTGGFLAMIRKDYRDFTDLHAATGGYRRENDQFKLSNLRLRQTTEQFKAEVGQLVEERKRFGEENERFALNNARNEGISDSMQGTLTEALARIRRGEDVSEQFFEEALAAIEEKKRMLAKVEEDILNRQDETLERYQVLAEQVSHMEVTGVKALSEATAELERVRQEIASDTATQKELGVQIAERREELRQEVMRLRAVRKDIEAATTRNLESANQIQRATTAMSFFFKGVCGFGDEEGVKQSRSMFFGIVIVGYIGWRMLAASAT